VEEVERTLRSAQSSEKRDTNIHYYTILLLTTKRYTSQYKLMNYSLL